MSTSGETRVATVAGSAASVAATATVTAPGAGTALASVNAPSSGTYLCTVSSWFGATGDTTGNTRAVVNGVPLAILPAQGGNNTAPVPYTFQAVLAAGQAVAVQNIAAGAAGSVYWASVVLTRIQ